MDAQIEKLDKEVSKLDTLDTTEIKRVHDTIRNEIATIAQKYAGGLNIQQLSTLDMGSLGNIIDKVTDPKDKSRLEKLYSNLQIVTDRMVGESGVLDNDPAGIRNSIVEKIRARAKKE